MTNNEIDNLISLLQRAQATINHMAADLNEHDLDCYYCAHFPDGGDGKCPMYSDNGSNGWCHFRWRLDDEIDSAVGKLRLDQIRELELKIRDHEEENKKEDEQLS